MNENLEYSKLSNLGKIITGNTPDTADQSNFDGEYPFVTPADLSGGMVELTPRTLTAKGVSQSRLVPANSLLFCAIGGGIGKSSLIRESSCFNQQIHAIIFNEALINYKFGNYCSGFISERMNHDAVVSTVPILNKTNFGKIKIPVPPLETQHKIVKFLDVETAHIDAGIANMESLIALLTEKRSALISEVVARGIPGEHTEFKASGVEWLGEIPTGWKISPLKKHLARNDGGAWGNDAGPGRETIILRSTEQTQDGEWKTTEPEKRFLTDREFRATKLEKDDLLVTKSSGSKKHIGKTTIVDDTVASLNAGYSNFMQRLRVDTATDARFVWYQFRSFSVREQMNLVANATIGLGNLNAKNLANLSLVFPPLETQQAIVKFLDTETTQINLAISNAKSVIHLMKEKRQTLISDVVTGKIDVRNSQLADD